MDIIKPDLKDVDKIKSIVDEFARKRDILPRSAEDIAERIREFAVVKFKGEVIAISSLRLYYPFLAEVRTIAVKKEHQGKGLAKSLIEYELKEAERLRIEKVFALTFQVEFFKRMGFELIDKKQLPQKKIWEDCVKCPFFPDCKEEAVIISLNKR